MSNTRIGLIITLGSLLLGATTAAGQHLWRPPGQAPGGAEPIRPVTIRPQSIGGGANGIYCPDMEDNAVGVHDLGWLPAGRNVVATVETSGSGNFDPVAAVLVATVGEKAGNAIKTNTFYDNDSGGDKNARVSFVTPTDGTYLLLVTDFPAKTGGCYRYQVDIR